MKAPMLRTTARAVLGSSGPKERTTSFLTLDMAADSKCFPVSRRRCPPGSVALQGAWNFSPHSKVPEGFDCVYLRIPYSVAETGKEIGRSLVSFLSQSRGIERHRLQTGCGEAEEKEAAHVQGHP